MDGFLSFLLAALFAALLAVIGFWAWRRRTQIGRTAIANAHGASATSRGTTSRRTAEGADPAPAANVRGAPGHRDAQCGLPRNPPPDGPAAAGTSVGEDDALVHSPVIALPTSQPLPVEEVLPQEHTRERSEADAPGAPPAEAGVPFGEKTEAAPPLGGRCATAAKEEGSGDGRAADGPGLAPMKPPVAEAKPEADRPSPPRIANGSPEPNTAGQANTPEARPSGAIEHIPADRADPAQPHSFADATAADVIVPLPSDLQCPADNSADRAADPIAGPDQEEPRETAATSDDNEQDGPTLEPSPPESKSEGATNRPSHRPSRPAIHRDRRGGRRSATLPITPSMGPPILPDPAARPPAEAKLRLSLHPIRQTARLSVVLARPDGFPQRVTLHIDGQPPIEAYNDRRYNDLDLPWTDEILDGEFRVTSTEGFQWLRSARLVHIFAEDASEPYLITVGAARAGATHTVVCRSGDSAAVCTVAESTGSPKLATHSGWRGIPNGWSVLSGYAPVHAATLPVPAKLRPIDPGAGIEIGFEGGLSIRVKVFAEGHPPRISISPEPIGASVTIGGQPAALAAGGGWEAPGWDAPGHHLIDVVPGPSAAYEIAADPWGGTGWEFWNAHHGRFGDRIVGPCARAEICGASIRGPGGQTVFAAETRPTLIVLGARSGAVPLRRRSDIYVSIGFVSEPPAFLLSATGQRRTQGRVIWLGLTSPERSSRRPDPEWVAAVRWAASRRLPLEGADSDGADAWRKAKAHARRLRKSRK